LAIEHCTFGFTSYKDLQMRYEKNHYQWPKAEKTFFDRRGGQRYFFWGVRFR